MLDLVRYARADKELNAQKLVGPKSTICACCQHMPATATVGDTTLCPTCLPAFALDASGIDHVASLIWLPQLEQGVLSRLVLTLHVTCARQSVTVRTAATGEAGIAAMNFELLKRRETALVNRIGTAKISEFREACKELKIDPVQRAHFVNGIRVLHHGCWFGDAPQLYDNYLRALIGGVPF
ncbi:MULTISPECIES: hypothetical protein [Asaia]|uniref:Uncharacterized protein n=1 Tax=Asaia spathodeae TaxID=657016 RepID=A0ABX2P963_9PROT|nr:hypothetical protein [Asaia spathodeae]GBR20276.1 hypothetical protein AA105894_2520 [Asaia spathodeae NBRC 105894]